MKLSLYSGLALAMLACWAQAARLQPVARPEVETETETETNTEA